MTTHDADAGIARANRLGDEVRSRYERIARAELERLDPPDYAYHAGDVWAGIAGAMAFANALWEPEAPDEVILANTDQAMTYVQITDDVEAAVRKQFGPAIVDPCPRCGRAGTDLCRMPGGQVRDKDHRTRPRSLHRDYRVLKQQGEAWVPQS